MLFYNLVFSYFLFLTRTNHKYTETLLLGYVLIFPFFTSYSNGDVQELVKYYNQDLLLLTSNYFTFLGLEDLFASPYVNLFTESQKMEILSRNIFFYFKFLNIPLVFSHILLNIFFFFSIKYFLSSFKIDKINYIFIFIFIIFSKLNLYYSLNIFRFYLGTIFFYLTFSSLVRKKNFLITLLLSILGVISHFAIIPFVIILLISNYINDNKFNKIYNYRFFFISFSLFYSYYLIYNQHITEIIYEDLFFGKFIVAKISNYLINSTGSQYYYNYEFIRICMVFCVFFLIYYINKFKIDNILKKFIFFSFIFIILFSFNTFIWKKYIYLIFPVISLIFLFILKSIYEKILYKVLNYGKLILIFISFFIIFSLYSMLIEMNYYYFLSYCFLILIFIYQLNIPMNNKHFIKYNFYNDLLFLLFIFYSTFNLTTLIRSKYLL
jgi:hypothetical protein